MDKTMHNELGEYAVRAGPAVAAQGLTFFGVPVSDVVQVLIAIYTILQIGWFIYSKVKKNGR